MRLPADQLKVRITCVLLGVLSLTSYGAGASARTADTAAAVNGPAADYPVVVGDPYLIGDVTYTPVDVMNYDAVGYITADGADAGITGSHHTLPLPSYVEVTSLETGRTILVRLERRGPMGSHDLIGLSDGALVQLGAASGAPVRVRRVNPLELERARLRAGEAAAPRMDTPISLVEVLKRKLPDAAPAAKLELAAAEPEESALPAVSDKVPSGAQAISPSFIVQAATFSTAERADSAAIALGGVATPAGKYFRVRTGPFATRGEAEASLAKVRDAGYTDARIYTSG